MVSLLFRTILALALGAIFLIAAMCALLGERLREANARRAMAKPPVRMPVRGSRTLWVEEVQS